MTLKHSALLLLALLIVCPTTLGQQVSHEELLEVLRIRSWRVPLPKDEKMHWGVEVVDYAPRTYTKDINVKLLDAQQKALIVLRDLGGDSYQVSAKHRGGLSQSQLKIALCTDAELVKNPESCGGGFTVNWHTEAKAFDDGAKFVLADIGHIYEQNKPRKQVVLIPKRFWGLH